ncbi:MAG TPA: DUF1801 domain-containing protein [Thermoanaerobaculia bacterium]
MSDLKTQPTAASVDDFLAALPAERRADCETLLSLLGRATGEPPRMWGPSIVGFGSYHYRYASGREGDWFLAGFSPRKKDLTVYVMAGFDGFEELLGRLGRHRLGKSCLYLRSLADVDLGVLEEMVGRSAREVARRYAGG